MKEAFTGLELREKIGYKSQQAITSAWKGVFQGEAYPGDSAQIGREKIEILLASLRRSARGRSKSISQASNELYSELFEVSKVEREKVKEIRPHIATFEQSVKVDRPNRVLHDSNFSRPNKTFEQVESRTLSLPTFPDLTKLLQAVSKIEFAFYLNMALANYGLWVFLDTIGIVWAMMYNIISLHALSMTRNSHSAQSAKKGIAFVWVLECLTFFIHFALFNRKLWDKGFAGHLGFDVYEMYMLPGVIAFVLSAIMVAGAIYSITISLSITNEKIDALNFESKYGEKY